MRKALIVLAALALCLAVSPAGKANASCWTVPACQSLCDQYCTSKNSTCQSASFDECYNGGTAACHVRCKSGSGYDPTCNCPAPGGSPIFKKPPTGPPPQPAAAKKSADKGAKFGQEEKTCPPAKK
jgi:hypothetical protein